MIQLEYFSIHECIQTLGIILESSTSESEDSINEVIGKVSCLIWVAIWCFTYILGDDNAFVKTSDNLLKFVMAQILPVKVFSNCFLVSIQKL